MLSFMQLHPRERERLVNAGVRRCTRKLNDDINHEDREDMQQEARIKMWHVCEQQGRDASSYDEWIAARN